MRDVPRLATAASAANPVFARSLASWHRAARSLSDDPTQGKALILVSVLADSRPVWSSGGPASGPWRGGPVGGPVGGSIGGTAIGGLWEARPYPDQVGLLRMLARFALSFRPPTGFLRDFVVELPASAAGSSTSSMAG